MGILTNLLRPMAVSPGPLADFWYSPVSLGLAGSGIRVDSETAQLNSAVFSCVRVISEALASLPAIIYRRLPADARERATDHPLYYVLHERPNGYQTPFEFKEYLQRAALLRGNGIAIIVPGERGAIQELIPWHPDAVKIERIRLGIGPNGVEQIVPRYRFRLSDQSELILNREDVFHHRSFTRDGITGVSVLEYARETIGLALATESYGARFFNQNAQPGGILEHPGRLTPEGIARLKADWEAKHAGLANAHRVAVLEEGMKWHQVGMTNEDAQFLASREFQIEDVARWFGVPLHMVGSMTKTTSWGSGVQELSIGFVRYTLMPWLTRWEESITRDLLLDTATYFIEFVVDALLRGDQKSRYDSYAIARQWGWLSVNDVRRLENMNPVDGGDAYLTPLNMMPGGRPSNPATAYHHDGLIRESAARVIRKEIAALGKAARRCANDRAQWAQAVAEFYTEHLAYVIQNMQIGAEMARAYVIQQQQILIEQGAIALDLFWQTDRLEALIDLTENQYGG